MANSPTKMLLGLGRINFKIDFPTDRITHTKVQPIPFDYHWWKECVFKENSSG